MIENYEQKRQVDLNYDAFQRVLAKVLPDHRNQFALMRDGRIVDFYVRPGDAYRAGLNRYGTTPFSIQEVTDEPIDLGLFSHVAN